MAELFESVRYLKGVGEARAKQFAVLGIHTLYDLIAHFPRSYEDRSQMRTIAQLEAGQPACFTAMVISYPKTSFVRKGLEITRVTVADESAQLKLTFFNQRHMAENLKYGQEYVFYGACDSGTRYAMSNPIVESPERPGVLTRRITPVYPLTAGISNRLMASSVLQALEACGGQIPEVLPEAVRNKYDLADAAFAYKTIHNPPSFDALEQARRRVVFEEFFIFSAGLSLLRAKRTLAHRTGYADCALQDFYDALPWPLTGAQQRAIDAILTDFQKDVPMSRLVQGDVGSGKTMVAAAAIACAARNGRQSALMAPTEILAEQHYAGLAPLLARLGCRCVLLTGSMSAKARREAKQALETGAAHCAIGTHALLSEDVCFRNLDLVVADEQHRFGVQQRAALSEKGDAPHLLVMSATPIPRTLSLILYGDLDVSIIDELPPGRQKVDTFLVGESMRTRVHAFIRRQAAEGHQCYIVCPAVEDAENDCVKSVQLWAQTLQKTVFPDLRVALLHGKMKGAEKEAVMAAFQAGQADILVATTVIEVGVDVPNATLIVVENADRFGLSQLHQLRGRVGRGDAKSYCILFSSNRNPQTLQRLKTLCKTNDGFAIAREDLAMRGPGDLLGSRQHGLPAFKVGSLSLDLQTLTQAQEAAAQYLSDPETAQKPEFQPLLQRMQALFQSEGPILN